jgi:hypothetical protein
LSSPPVLSADAGRESTLDDGRAVVDIDGVRSTAWPLRSRFSAPGSLDAVAHAEELDARLRTSHANLRGQARPSAES